MALARRGTADLMLLAALSAGACNLSTKNNTGFYVATGTCSGTPLSCAGLPGTDCPRIPGCQDTGVCTGVAATTGVACSAQTSFSACSSTTGCFWQANCTGQPTGTCSAVTEQLCTAVPGCTWTSYLGTGGAGSTCSTYQAACASDADCDCGFTCVHPCSSCSTSCGHACQSNVDCVAAVGNLGRATPTCRKLDPSPTALGSCVE